MSQEQRSKLSLMILRALADNTSAVVPVQYRIAPDSAILDETEAEAVLTRLPKPLSCSSRTEADTIVLDCRKLEEEYRAPGIVEAWVRFQRKLQDLLVKRVVRVAGEFPDDLSVRIVAGGEDAELPFTEYCGWMLEYHFPRALIQEDVPAFEAARPHSTLTMTFEVWSGPQIEGSVRFSPESQ